jgi:hypothetical protein
MLSLLLGLACFAGAAGGDKNPQPTGQYGLVNVGGHSLPALWQETELVGGAWLRAWWVSGRAAFCPDRTYHVALTLRATGPGVLGQPVVVTMTGSWRPMRDGRIEVRPSHGGHFYWRVKGDTLVLRARMAPSAGIGEGADSATFVFTRGSFADSGVGLPPFLAARNQ